MKLCALLPLLLLLFHGIAQAQPEDTTAYRLFNDPVRPDKGIHREIGKIELVTLKKECNTRYYPSSKNPRNRDSMIVACHPQSILSEMESGSGCSMDSSLIDCRAWLTDEERERLLNVLIIAPDPNSVHAYCYEPRNGVLFYDTDGKLVAYIELCFQCGNQLLLIDDRVSFLNDLTGRKVLKQLFVEHDLGYGVLYQ